MVVGVVVVAAAVVGVVVALIAAAIVSVVDVIIDVVGVDLVFIGQRSSIQDVREVHWQHNSTQAHPRGFVFQLSSFVLSSSSRIGSF